MRSIIRRSIRKVAPTVLLLLVGYLVSKFIEVEVWLVNQNPYFNSADLIAIALLVILVRLVNKVIKHFEGK